MNNLIIISIGPVQEFIASARRSRDLWFGSWLLSELSKSAARRIVAEHNNDLNCLVFPKPKTIDDLKENGPFNVVNKIVALVRKSPDEVGRAVYQSIIARLETIRNNAFNEVKAPAGYFRRAIAEVQVNDLVEYFWAAARVDDPQDENKYAAARDLAESLLSARKATRDFRQILPQPQDKRPPRAMEWAAPVPKSSLDGLRESVIHEDAYQKLDATQLRVRYGVRKGERLCGVGLLKRLGHRAGEDGFFSTSHVAALPLLNTFEDTEQNRTAFYQYMSKLAELLVEIDNNELHKIFGKIPKKAEHPVFGRHDGHLLFEERLHEFFDDEAVKEAKKALRSFLNGRNPNPYYALLLADGDRMGKAIDQQRRIELHQNLSEQLTAFARSVQAIVEDTHQGSLVYAGGDDVLAFVPLHTVLPCARALARRFEEELRGFPTGKVDAQTQPPSPTLSVGIAITHHIEPLSDALELARQAEKTAKSAGRNALVITLSKRSGVDRTVKGQWGTIDRRLNRFVWLHRAEAIPDGAAYDLQDLALRLDGVKPDAVRAEALRIIGRKRVEQGQKPIPIEVLEELKQFINDKDVPIEQLADELIIAALLARTTKQAGIELDKLPDAAITKSQPAPTEENNNDDLDH